MIDFEKLERQLSARKMGHTRRMGRLGAARRRLEDRIAAHRRDIETSLESIALLEAEVAKLDEFERDVEARSRSRRSVAPAGEAVVRLDLFEQALDADMTAHGLAPDEEALSLAAVAARRRPGDGFVWASALRVAPADAGAAPGADPQLPQDLSEHLRRALAIPGYAHVAYAVERQWMGNDVLDMAQRFAEERRTPMLALRDEFVGDAIDRTAAMAKGAAWVEQAKKTLKRGD